jgi:hypothetical protein
MNELRFPHTSSSADDSVEHEVQFFKVYFGRFKFFIILIIFVRFLDLTVLFTFDIH